MTLFLMLLFFSTSPPFVLKQGRKSRRRNEFSNVFAQDIMKVRLHKVWFSSTESTNCRIEHQKACQTAIFCHHHYWKMHRKTCWWWTTKNNKKNILWLLLLLFPLLGYARDPPILQSLVVFSSQTQPELNCGGVYVTRQHVLTHLECGLSIKKNQLVPQSPISKSGRGGETSKVSGNFFSF